jgi:diguanylate cyclase (GGDEF)-like protein
MRSKISTASRDTVFAAGVVAVLFGGTWAISNATVEHLLRHDAVSTAHTWASYLVKNVEDLELIAAGQKPSVDSQRFFDRVKQVGQVFRYTIYDPQGHFRLVSDDLDDDPDENQDLATHNPEVIKLIAAGEPMINVEEGKPPTRPPFFAEGYVPVIQEGKTIAIVEVYVDQTSKRDDYRRTFFASTGALGILMALAFGIPAVAWRRRTNEKRIADEHIRFLAHHDSLTGLPNRDQLTGKVSAALQGRRSRGGHLALHYVDVDRFKDVNDSLGHEAGDALITEIARRLRAIAAPEDVVARLGGDEFVVLQISVVDRIGATQLAQAIIAELARPYVIKRHEIGITASIGVAIAPEHGEDAAQLIKSADLALYRSKADGRNAVRVFSFEMEADLNERLRLERAIRDALIGDRFELHFQPAVQMPERRLVGFEALLRLKDELGVPIPPTIFIPIAEQMGLIGAIGTWVLREACRTAANWPADLKVAVNLSPVQFSDGNLFETVVSALADAGLEPHRLELEITEGLLLKDTAAVMGELHKLKDFNVGIVMDDFGTGYSSLSYLWKFPFDKLKIDRAFMLALDADDRESAETIVRTIIHLGQSLDVTVTVEGVENDRQVNFVEAAGCDQIQGYYFARPLPVTDLASYIVDHHKATMPIAMQARVEVSAVG